MKPIPGLHLILIALFITGITSCQKELHFEPQPVKDHNLVLRFQPVVQFDTNNLEFGTTYTNFFGEPFTVKTFKFYIHGITLVNTDSNKVFRINNDKYFLVDCADSANSRLEIAVLPNKYNRIILIIGVDSARNVSGAQTGALDPALGMFWTWNTGYIMAKLEGTSPVSQQGGNMFEFHIGGFREPDNVITPATLLFPFGEFVDMQQGKTTEIVITADVYDWFNNPHDIRLSDHPVITMPGPLAKQVSENYSNMFTVTEIINEP